VLGVNNLTSLFYDFDATWTAVNCMSSGTFAVDTETNCLESAAGIDLTAAFRFNAGSNGIDDGVDTSGDGVTTDIDGTARGATYDIGCDEYVSAVTARRRAIKW
jgi:hypothetical protein